MTTRFLIVVVSMVAATSANELGQDRRCWQDDVSWLCQKKMRMKRGICSTPDPCASRCKAKRFAMVADDIHP
jgi:hypothetical protein